MLPNKLTDTKLALLSAAAQRADGAIELASNLKGGAAHRVIGKRLREEGGVLVDQSRALRSAWCSFRRS